MTPISEPRVRFPHRRLLFSFLLTLLLLCTAGDVAAEDHWGHDAPERFIKGLTTPVDIAFGGDGYLYYVSLIEEEIRRIHLDSAAVDPDFVLELPDAHWENGSETGVFGFALHPEFHANGVLYVSYSSFDPDLPEDEQWTNVLARITLTDASGAMSEEVLLVRPGGLFHNGGRLLLTDEHLWWTTGDALNPFTHNPQEHGVVAQEDGTLRGKVLRLDMDGRPAAGNPWGDHAYTKGHRNVFGIAWDPVHQQVFVTENGDARTDYIYLLTAGANHGWPECEGFCNEDRPEYTDPLWGSEGTIAPTGATWFRDAFWFGSFNQGDLFRVHNATGEWEVTNVYHYPGTDKFDPRILQVEVGPDGNSLWFSTWDEIWRMAFTPHPDHPGTTLAKEGPFWWESAGGPAGTLDGGGNDTGDASGPGLLLVLAMLAAAFVIGGRMPPRRPA